MKRTVRRTLILSMASVAVLGGLMMTRIVAQDQNNQQTIAKATPIGNKPNGRGTLKMRNEYNGDTQDNTGVQLSLQPVKAIVAPGYAVILKVTVTNTGTEDIYSDEASSETDFSVIVKNEQGQAMPPTRYGDMDSTARFKNMIMRFEPGKSREYEIIVNRLADMTVSGKYSVAVTRKFFKEQSQTAQISRSDFVDVVVDETAQK